MEIIFSFDESLLDDKELLVLSSFVTGNNIEELTKQFRVPQEYLKYYSDKKALIIADGNSFCVSSENAVMSESDIVLNDIDFNI